VQVAWTKAYPILSSNATPLCLGELTAGLTGQTLSTSSGDGLSGVAGSSPTSPSHVGRTTRIGLVAA
jgi:hypothetical protein